MKSIVLIAAGLAVSISGCASLADQAATYDSGVDTQKVTAINNIARARGVEVHWVNYPQRKKTPPAVVPSLGPSGT